jgi:uncharacterized protein YfbU (UPF0304 family)
MLDLQSLGFLTGLAVLGIVEWRGTKRFHGLIEQNCQILKAIGEVDTHLYESIASLVHHEDAREEIAKLLGIQGVSEKRGLTEVMADVRVRLERLNRCERDLRQYQS